MSIFNLFKKKPQLSEDALKWNLMWDMWVKGTAASPYAELMEYHAEVNNGGHGQYFENVSNCGDLKASIDILLTILPPPLHDNLIRGYDAFLIQNERPVYDGPDELDDQIEACDDVFYENEQLVIDLLKAYADTLPL